MLLTLALVVAVAAAVRGVWSPCGLSMLSALNPVSERSRGHRFGATASWYVASAVAGGGLLGGGSALAAAGVGRLHLGPGWTWSLVLAGAAVAVLSDSPMVGPALPVHPRQVDERWLGTYRRWIYAGGFGLQIGTGFATYIMTAAVYLTAALAVLTGRPWAALAVGLTFGGVRGLAILLAAPAGTPEALRALMATVDRCAGPSLIVVATIEATAGAVAAWSLAGPVGAVLAAAALGVPALAPAGRRRLAARAG